MKTLLLVEDGEIDIFLMKRAIELAGLPCAQLPESHPSSRFGLLPTPTVNHPSAHGLHRVVKRLS